MFWEQFLGFLSILSISSGLMFSPGGIAWCSIREGGEKSKAELSEDVWESGLVDRI